MDEYEMDKITIQVANATVKKYTYENVKRTIKDIIEFNVPYKEKMELLRTFIANFLIEKYNIHTIDDEMILYNAKTGLYEEGKDFIISKIQYIYHLSFSELEGKLTTTTVNEIINLIKRKTYKKREEIENRDPNLIPFENGIYDIEKKVFFDFSPEYVFFSKINTKYDPTATECPTFIRFLEKITGNDPRKINLIQDMMGYCLWRTNKLEKIFFLVGAGANGKSTLLKILTEILGYQNVSYRTLHEIIEDKFALVDLKDKFANISMEIKSSDLKYFDRIKSLTSGDLLTANRKFKESISFANYSKLIFATNKLPRINEDTDAVYRRIVVIPFEVQIPIEEQDPDLFEKLKKEKSAILNYMLG
ncbi:MAG: DNA primase family protein, partial [Candidatus Ratteibacteria bacterium]